jgi:hypothetical protein
MVALADHADREQAKKSLINECAFPSTVIRTVSRERTATIAFGNIQLSSRVEYPLVCASAGVHGRAKYLCASIDPRLGVSCAFRPESLSLLHR